VFLLIFGYSREMSAIMSGEPVFYYSNLECG